MKIFKWLVHNDRYQARHGRSAPIGAMNGMPPDRLVFFLGGRDLEMVTIRALLQAHAPTMFYDKGLAWGARASAYQGEIEGALAEGKTPVFIELENDLGLDPATTIVIVDHHGERAGAEEPTSLHQVFRLLGLPAAAWTHWHELVAANDRGHIPALLEAGATQEEIVRVRAADRAAQGITPEEEAQGERAAACAETLLKGKLTITRLPHSRTATVADRLHHALGEPGYKNLLVLCPHEVDFFVIGASARSEISRGLVRRSIARTGLLGAWATLPPGSTDRALSAATALGAAGETCSTHYVLIVRRGYLNEDLHASRKLATVFLGHRLRQIGPARAPPVHCRTTVGEDDAGYLSLSA
ncbi:MAG: hypothetical protein ACREXW_03240 [Gammaproteobacteria bacterium]